MDKKTIVSIEDRIPKLKEARKKKANRRLIMYLCAFFLLISVIVYLQSPLSHVKHIEVTGNNFLTKKTVKELSSVTKKTNIWTLSKSEIEKKLTDNPVIESVNIKRSLPNTVVFEVKERKVIGYISKENHCQPIVENGSILDMQAKRLNGEVPVLREFKDDAYFKKMTSELGKLNEDIRKLISEVYWSPEKDNKNKIKLYMNDGFVVESGLKGFANNMKVYPSISSQLDPKKKGIIHIGRGAYFEEIK